MRRPDRYRPKLHLGVADQYAATGEAIYELIDPRTGLGGLVSLRRTDDGGLRVQLYRLDLGVSVDVAPAGGLFDPPAPTEGS